MNIRSILLFISIFLLHSAHSQYVIFDISNSDNAPNEVSVSVNPKNMGNIVAASNLINIYASQDSGTSWKEFLQKSSLGPYGDPVIHCDDSGIFYHAHLSKTPGKDRPDYMDRMIVQRSLDGGQTWSDGVGVGYNKGKMQDKEWLCTDGSTASSFNGNLYLSWTEFDVYGSKDSNDRSRIRFARSSDRAKSFSEAVTISDQTGNCEDDDLTLEGATAATDKSGNIYVVWAGNHKIYLDKSADGGKTFGKDEVIAKQKEGWAHDIPNIFRTNGMPFIAIHKEQDAAFVVYSDKKEEDEFYKVYLLAKEKKGWTHLDYLHLPDPGFQGHVFFPNIAVNQEAEKVGIVYYQQNKAGDSLQVKLLNLPFGGGAKIQVLSESFPAPGKRVFFGDYIDIDAFGGDFFCTWTAVKDGQLIIQGARPLSPYSEE